MTKGVNPDKTVSLRLVSQYITYPPIHTFLPKTILDLNQEITVFTPPVKIMAKIFGDYRNYCYVCIYNIM